MKPTNIDNLNAVLYKIKDLRLEQRAMPVIRDDEALIQMACVGICGSDVHFYVNGRIANYVVKKPMVIGHEGSGIIVKVGKNVKTLKEGDRVAIEPGVPCRVCSFCKEGRYNLCRDIKFCAAPPVDGNLCRYFAHAADFCHKLPAHVSLEEGALLEPLSVGMHACRKGGVNVGTTVLILGAGTIGLATVICAKAMGANRIIISDVLDFKLNAAREFGADHTLLTKSTESPKELARKIEETLGGDLPDVTIDCAGFEATVRLGIEATKSGGTLVVVGMGANEVTIPLVEATLREIAIKGIFRYANDYPTALAMLSSGKTKNIGRLITHKYRLEETLEAFETARTGSGEAIKVMIHCRLNDKSLESNKK